LKYFDYPEDKAEKLAKLSEKLFYEEEWYKTYQGSPQTNFFRVIPVQQSVKSETQIVPYDDIEQVIDNARIVSLAKCMCKMRKEFLGKRECKDKYPLETCIQLNLGAQYFIETGLGREISKEQAKKLCKEFNKMGLVHTTENFNEGNHTLICNCCSCCCVPLAGMIKYDDPHTVAAANYVAEIINPEKCEKCESCVEKCIFNAISVEINGPIINNKKCMGCGVCVVNCPSNILELRPIERSIVPRNFMELGLTIGREMR
jgi:Pyruvate/2-oxoacid:ferredoxin oxidoreductase delta subunit